MSIKCVSFCRFSIPSTRNRHIARAHGTYGRKYDEDFSQYNSTETSNSDDFDNGEYKSKWFY